MHIKYLYDLIIFVSVSVAIWGFFRYYSTCLCPRCNKRVEKKKDLLYHGFGGGSDRIESLACDNCGCRAVRKSHNPDLWSGTKPYKTGWQIEA